MRSCMVCLQPAPDDEPYHPNCAAGLFGTTRAPHVEFDLSGLYREAQRMAGKMSISGMQEKLSLVLSPDQRTLQVQECGGRFIMKPESSRHPSLPANEHLTMRLATLVEIEIPPCGLVALRDSSLAYVVKRFDRLEGGGKVQVEDFCQLTGTPARDKYSGSAELVVRLIKRYATEPLIELQKFFRQLLFGWWVGNGDMHLKNSSILTAPDGIHCLAPAYDFLCTRLVLPDDRLALPIQGKDGNLTRRKWLDLAAYCRIPEKAARRLLETQSNASPAAVELIDASYLSPAMKTNYREIVRENTATLLR